MLGVEFGECLERISSLGREPGSPGFEAESPGFDVESPGFEREGWSAQKCFEKLHEISKKVIRRSRYDFILRCLEQTSGSLRRKTNFCTRFRNIRVGKGSCSGSGRQAR